MIDDQNVKHGDVTKLDLNDILDDIDEADAGTTHLMMKHHKMKNKNGYKQMGKKNNPSVLNNKEIEKRQPDVETWKINFEKNGMRENRRSYKKLMQKAPFTEFDRNTDEDKYHGME